MMTEIQLLRMMERSPTLTSDNCSTEPIDPDRARPILEKFIVYTQKIEADTANTAKTIKLFSNRPYIPHWVRHEVEGHAVIMAEQAQNVGLPVEWPEEREPSRTEINAARIAQISRKFSRVMNLIISKKTVINEYSNMALQQRIISALEAQGEVGLARTWRRAYGQESLHARMGEYYLGVDLSESTACEQSLADFVVAHDFRLVGANSPDRFKECGGVLGALFGDDDSPEAEIISIVSQCIKSKRHLNNIAEAVHDCRMAALAA